jgi:hypothetical protein
MGNDDRGAFVHFDRNAGELIDADADFPTTDGLHRGIRVDGVTAGGEHAERGEADGVTTDGAAAAGSKRTDTSSRTTQRVANVSSDLCDLFRHDVSPHWLIFDERDKGPAVGSGRSVRTPVRHGIHGRPGAAEGSKPAQGQFRHGPAAFLRGRSYFFMGVNKSSQPGRQRARQAGEAAVYVGGGRTLHCLGEMRPPWSLFECRWAGRFHSIRCTGGALNARRKVERSSCVPAGFLQCVCQASLPTPGRGGQ